ncbi:MAG: ectoine/hydroxyectoine ABC transporter permease subunit EhuC, partial [Leucobacter sp.]|nr:ectoine/hydroxyectoine ABC transporter permease subunit EhuC [Leucobacter sp.]
MIENIEALGRAWPRIMEGLGITVTLTLGGALLAFMIAIALGLLARSRSV